MSVRRLVALRIAQVAQRHILATALMVFQGRILAALARRRRIAILEHLFRVCGGTRHFLAGCLQILLVVAGIEKASIVGILDAGNQYAGAEFLRGAEVIIEIAAGVFAADGVDADGRIRLEARREGLTGLRIGELPVREELAHDHAAKVLVADHGMGRELAQQEVLIWAVLDGNGLDLHIAGGRM